MKVITAPEPLDRSGAASVFLAGGITNCSDWQSGAIHRLSISDGTPEQDLAAMLALVVYNPRRPDFDLSDPTATKVQIQWEHDALRAAEALIFWFTDEAIQPITLYELGAWSMTNKPLFVGAAPQYIRRADVVEQTRLARPDIYVRETLTEVVNDFKRWYSEEVF